MSGHSKWSTIKRKKGANDAKRGAVFTRLAREIALAARTGGGDVDANFALRLAMEKARAENMPKDNIERAIKRGLGEDKDAAEIGEYMYEGYAPHGVALLINVVTDNKNRVVADLRHHLQRGGGSMAEGGAVSWQFTRKAYFYIPTEGKNFDTIFELAADAGADDVLEEDGYFEIVAPVETFKEISDRLRFAHIQAEDAGLKMVPNHEVELDPDGTLQIMRLIESLEELDDIQNVYSNLHISDEALAQLETA